MCHRGELRYCQHRGNERRDKSEKASVTFPISPFECVEIQSYAMVLLVVKKLLGGLTSTDEIWRETVSTDSP